MKVADLPYTYFCTGARNESLLPLFNTGRISFEIDERAASFKALGFAKATLQPVAICTTSGTAVSECLSAMIEATYSEIPLLLISADRPERMHSTGAPQTINHEIITRAYRRTYLQLTFSEFTNLDLSQVLYPAHINVIIDSKSEREPSQVAQFENNWEGFNLFLQNHPRPLFLISHESESMRNFVEKLSKTRILFYSEALSQSHDLSPIKFETDLIKALKNNQFSSVIRIGHTPLSKAWRMLENYHLPTFSFDSRALTALSYGNVMPLSAKELNCSSQFWNAVANLEPFKIPLKSSTDLKQLINIFPRSEVSCLSLLQEFIPEGSIVYLGNSLSIRFFEMAQKKNYVFFGNRGANGIDGQLATAIGLSQSTQERVYCILGDLTTQYDLSSLASLPQNLKLIIMNNYGGRIFETMKLSPKMVLEHELNFERFANAFNLTYSRNDYEKFNHSQVFEINPMNTETMEMLSRWEA